MVLSELLANAPELTPEKVTAWTRVLELAGVQPEQVGPAALRLAQQEKFFPTPADFLKIIRPPEDEDAQAELAWQQVLVCVATVGIYGTLTAADLNGDRQALWAVQRLGWSEICEGDPRQRAITRASFIRVYQAARSAGKATERVPGLHELKNDSDGRDLTPELVGRATPDALPGGAEAPAPERKALAAPRCPDCGALGRRHLITCGVYAHLDRPKALRAGEAQDFTPLGAAIAAAAPALPEKGAA